MRLSLSAKSDGMPFLVWLGWQEELTDRYWCLSVLDTGYPRHWWRWRPCLLCRRMLYWCARSSRAAYCHLFTIVEEAPPLLAVNFRRLPVISHLEEFKIFFDTVFPSLVWLPRFLLPFASSLMSTCFGARWLAMRHTWPNRNVTGSSLWPLQ